jgi:hypothetical protein
MGRHPRRCKNQLPDQFGNSLPIAGELSPSSYIAKAKYISPTRMECYVPEFIFEEDFKDTINSETTLYSCEWIHWSGLRLSNGTYAADQFPEDIDTGNFSYVRACNDPLVGCMNLPAPTLEYHIGLVIPCTVTEIFEGVCSNNPEKGYFFNPCISAEVSIEVTNDGEHYSGGVEMQGQTRYATIQTEDPTNIIYRNHKNMHVPATFATYTYIMPEYMYTNNDILIKKKLLSSSEI